MKEISISTILIFLFLCSCEQNLCKNEYTNAPLLSKEYPCLTFGVLTSARIAALDDDVLFCFNGKKYTHRAIEKKLNINLSDQTSFQQVENYIENLFLADSLNTKTGDSGETSFQSLKQNLLKQATGQNAITEKEAREYFSRNRIWFEGSTFEQVREYVSRLTLEDKEEEYFLEYLKEAGKSIPIILSKSWIEEISPSIYSHPIYKSLKEDKIKVIVFSYGCCKPDVMIGEIKILEDFYREVINTIHIDSKIEYELAERFKVKVNPTILVFDEQVRLKRRFIYYHSADEILNVVNKIRENQK